MAIINDKELLEDSLQILTEHFEIPEPDAIKILTNDQMLYIIEQMYTTQESLLADLAMNYKKQKEK